MARFEIFNEANEYWWRLDERGKTVARSKAGFPSVKHLDDGLDLVIKQAGKEKNFKVISEGKKFSWIMSADKDSVLAVAAQLFLTEADAEKHAKEFRKLVSGPERMFEPEKTQQHYRIGLALSGGGYRASLFHLGVIRRLEELGIMQDVSVMSCVSGGSILGAFYAVEMENRLRTKESDIQAIWDKYCEAPNEARLRIAEIRLELFEEITDKFFKAMNANMRMRATLFAPFYHPLATLKALREEGYSRANLIQVEYDKWFFDKAVVDHLPSYHIEEIDDPSEAGPEYHVYELYKEGKPTLYKQKGVKVVINTTSLLDGGIVSFARSPVYGFNEMTKTNKNIEPLSRPVGASSAVPGVFPPAIISGEVLADGGVSDNQGLHIFLGQEQRYASNRELCEPCNVLLVSDASGQMLKVDQISNSELAVVARTQGVQSFELRNRNIDELVLWKTENPEKQRMFAFIHLYRSLKDREDYVGHNRVPSDYITALGGLRTDLDQFSAIEREALMYHGYTLIDNQLREWCEPLLKQRGLETPEKSRELNQHLDKLIETDELKFKEHQKLRKPPIFQYKPDVNSEEGDNADPSEDLRNYRRKIKRHLEAGKLLLLTQRLNLTNKWAIRSFMAVYLGIIVLLFLTVYPMLQEMMDTFFGDYILSFFNSLIPSWLSDGYGWLVDQGYAFWPLTAEGVQLLLTVALFVLVAYIVLGILYRIFQPATVLLDAKNYRDFTKVEIREPGESEHVKWQVSED